MGKNTQKINYAVEMVNITKTFGTIVANENIDLKVQKGSIHAIIGENGAGKSTLMSILFGLYEPSAGHIKINGKQVDVKDPNVANELKIGMVHQHFKLVGIYNALENIMLGSEKTVAKQIISKKMAQRKIEELQKEFKLDFPLDVKVDKLSVGVQQKIEIMKMLYRDADILVYDEPSAVLTPIEIEGLLKSMEHFKKLGKTIIFITHKLHEVMEVADRATVIRKGKLVDTVEIKNASIEKLSEMMVGQKIAKAKNKVGAITEEPIITLREVSLKKTSQHKALHDISFDIKKGEIVAVAGVEGNGQTELAEVISGLVKPNNGTITFNGKDITKMSVSKRYKTINGEPGISHVPEDRLKHAAVLNFTVRDNMVLQTISNVEFSGYGIIKQPSINKFAKKIIEKFDVRGAREGSSNFRSLSGGNQQKAVVGREMTHEHNLLIAAQPTRGLDIGAIDFIHKNIIKEKQNGKAILLISFELDEVLALADRIIVMADGKITGIRETNKVTKTELGLLMAGGKD